jgi:mercuric ion transport protein
MPTRLEAPSHNRSDDNESDDRGVPGVSCGDGGCCGVLGGSAPHPLDAPPELSSRRSAARGLLWIAGGFLFCPCHLPLTLWLLATVLAGTAAGALFHDHVVIAEIVISAAWAAATWRGVRLLR